MFSRVKVNFREEENQFTPLPPTEIKTSPVNKNISGSRSRSRSGSRKFTSAELHRKSVPKNASLKKQTTGFINWQTETSVKKSKIKTPTKNR